MVNLFSNYKGEAYQSNTASLGTEKEERFSTGLTLYPLRWFEVGGMLSIKEVKESNNSLLTNLATLRTTISLPYQLEVSGYLRAAKQSDNIMDGYSTELGYTFMNMLKLAIGYNYSRRGNLFELDDGEYGLYARLNAFKFAVGK